MGTWIKPFTGDINSKSGTYTTNLLYKKDKFYIMDNHLSATWCWLQELASNQKYNYFHIDRHYDWLDNKPEFLEYLTDRNIVLENKSFDEYCNLIDEEMENHLGNTFVYKLFRFDNYLPLFFRAYPNSLDKMYFATHHDGTEPEDIDYEPKIYELYGNISYWMLDDYINKETDKWVFNLDIDYFFYEHGDEKAIQFLTDEYILKICQELSEVIEKVQVVTIAMSPEFCGGWKNSYRITKLISDYFKLDFSLDLQPKN